jgi:DNA-binding transcriptional ArsR family regulator
MLEHLFGSTVRLRILQALYRRPDKPVFVRELARLINSQLNAVRRELENLQKMGLVIPVAESVVNESAKTPAGPHHKYYRLNTLAFIYEELRDLLIKARMSEERILLEEMTHKGGDIKLLLLTGVFTGVEGVETDILIVGQVKPLVVSRIIKDFEKIMQQAVRYTIMEEKEFVERREIGDRFLYSLFEAKHLTVVDSFSVN